MIRSLAVIALALTAVAPVQAQTAPAPVAQTPAPSLEWMVGEWRGTGKLFGHDSAVSLVVKPIIGGAGYGFDYSITVAAADGKPEMRFTAHAFYQTAKGKKWHGRWVDNFGNLHDISGDVADGALTSVWGSPSTEIGRSSYVREGGILRITDWTFRKSGQFEEFASSALTKN